MLFPYFIFVPTYIEFMFLNYLLQIVTISLWCKIWTVQKIIYLVLSMHSYCCINFSFILRNKLFVIYCEGVNKQSEMEMFLAYFVSHMGVTS
jgi:hypothetical protein